MPFSKYEPHKPVEEEPEATSESAGRRVWVLRWGWRISQGAWILGLLLMLYWIWRSKT